jgi:hypothetical protein
VNGSDHYREGERLLSRCADMAEGTDARAGAATEAAAHFLAALAASHATHHHPDSVAWDQAINGTEQP